MYVFGIYMQSLKNSVTALVNQKRRLHQHVGQQNFINGEIEVYRIWCTVQISIHKIMAYSILCQLNNFNEPETVCQEFFVSKQREWYR